jgi:hypothetical protein
MRVDLKNFTFTKFKEEQVKNSTVGKDTVVSRINKERNMELRLKREMLVKK